jgi:DNA polymerase I-like protein with 3'-5' exonuclease and polymerase domains
VVSSNVILDEGRLKEAVDYFLQQDMFSFDVETVGDNRGQPHLNEVTWMSLGTKGSSIVVPMGHPIGSRLLRYDIEPRLCQDGKTRKYKVPVYEPPPPQIPRDNAFEILRPLFFNDRQIKSAHGAVFDIASTAKYWGEVCYPPYNCSIVSRWLLHEDEHRLKYGLKEQVQRRLGFTYEDKNVGKQIEKVPFRKAAYYAYCDALYAYLLPTEDIPLIKSEGLWDTYLLEMDLLNVLVGIRLSGSPMDVPQLEQLRVDVGQQVVEARETVWEEAGREFNLNSPPQRQHILYGPKKSGGQGLKPWKLTDTGKKRADAGEDMTKVLSGWSTDAESLQAYPTNPVAQAILEYQEVNKLLTTYIVAYLGDDEAGKPCQIFDGSIYADFVQYGTNTGRFSCREPNLQNIPRPDTELGKLIRGAWKAEPGHKLVVGDYGQIELVIFAHYAGHGALYDGFWAGLDPHTVTAARILDKDPDEVAPEERQYYGKTMNFAMSFGAGLNLVASMLGMDQAAAKQVLKTHRMAFPEIYALKQGIIDLCKSREPVPFVLTLAGHRRCLPDINLKGTKDALVKKRMYAERQAVSAVVQGSAADLIKMAMVRFDSDPRCGDDIQLILTVHDELVVHCPEDKAELAAEIMREAMLGDGIQQLINVPLTADVKIVDRWSEAK